jgi:hypothetical protein
MDDYQRISETKLHIKSMLQELFVLETSKAVIQEDLVERVLYLLELYVTQEVDAHIASLVPAITQAIIQTIKEEGKL